MPLAVAFYFQRDVCSCTDLPARIGLALLVAGGATIAWWVARPAGRREPPAALTVIGGVAGLTAVALGTIRVVQEIGRILAG